MNQYIDGRLKGILEILVGSFVAGEKLSSATKGNERELFIEEFLAKVFPPIIRFGNGDITDTNNNRSGQVDIVIESPYLFSFPIHSNGSRLYLAEGVGATLEVKSNVMSQWDEVVATTFSIKNLRRRYKKKHFEDLGNLLLAPPKNIQEIYPDSYWEETKKWREQAAVDFLKQANEMPTIRDDIPVYAIGYKGWKGVKTMQEKLREAKLDGLIVLDPLNAVFADTGPFESSIWGLMQLLDKLSYDVQQTVFQVPTVINYFSATFTQR